MKQKDIEYIATNMSNLSGIPVRLYKNKEKIFYYSINNLTVDPILIDENKVFNSNKSVSYFINDFSYYYGVLSFKEYKLVLGPTRQVPISNQELMNLAFELEINQNELEDFKNNMKIIVHIPLASLLQMLCITNYIFNNEKLSLEDVQITETTQEKIINTLEKESINQTLNNIENPEQYSHNSYGIEQIIVDYVRKGEVTLLKEYFKKIPAVRSGITSKDAYKQIVNIFIITCTLVSRAAIRGGLDIEEALSLSDSYIQKCELENSVENIVNLQYRMVIDYAERVEKSRFGDNTSKLVLEVVNYVKHHLSDTINVNDIAKELYLSRSYLSIVFKKETGIPIAQFITKEKMNEAKRLLKYSDKSPSLISLYLGYSSQSHFNRVFKKYTSLTPNEYRRKYTK